MVGEERIAGQRLDAGDHLVSDHIAVAEIGHAAFLGDFLSLQAVKGEQGVFDHLFARPELVDLALQRLDGLLGLAVNHGAADVTDDVVRLRNGGVGQQRQHGFQAATGHKYQVYFGVGGNQSVELEAVVGITREKSTIEIGGQ